MAEGGVTPEEEGAIEAAKSPEQEALDSYNELVTTLANIKPFQEKAVEVFLRNKGLVEFQLPGDQGWFRVGVSNPAFTGIMRREAPQLSRLSLEHGNVVTVSPVETKFDPDYSLTFQLSKYRRSDESVDGIEYWDKEVGSVGEISSGRTGTHRGTIEPEVLTNAKTIIGKLQTAANPPTTATNP